MLPPNSVTIPRTELPMDQLLNIHHDGVERKCILTNFCLLINLFFVMYDREEKKYFRINIDLLECKYKTDLYLYAIYCYSVSSPSRSTDEFSNNFPEEKESGEFEILRIFDGNNSLRNLVFRTAPIPKTATVEQIRVKVSGISYQEFNNFRISPFGDFTFTTRTKTTTM